MYALVIISVAMAAIATAQFPNLGGGIFGGPTNGTSLLTPLSNAGRRLVVRPLFGRAGFNRQQPAGGVQRQQIPGGVQRQNQQQPQVLGPASLAGPVRPQTRQSNASSTSNSQGAGFGPFGPMVGGSSSTAGGTGSARGSANGASSGAGNGNGIYGGESNGASGTNAGSDSNAQTQSQTIVGDGFMQTSSSGTSTSTSQSSSTSNHASRIRGKK